MTNRRDNSRHIRARRGPEMPAATQPTKGDKREYKAGAIVFAESIAPDEARMVDVTIKANKLSDGVIPEVFVAEGPLDDAKASSGRELVWLLKDGIVRVVNGLPI